MNITRTVVIGVAGGALAAWFAAASTSNTRPAVASLNARSASIDKSGAQLAAEIGRLHERLHPTAVPENPARNLFAFGAREPHVAPASVAASAAPPVPAAAEIAPPPLALVGVAEDAGVRTAVLSGLGQLFLVKQGDSVAGRYTVVRVDQMSVDVTDAAQNADSRSFRLSLK